jgi:hypothetical protein
MSLIDGGGSSGSLRFLLLLFEESLVAILCLFQLVDKDPGHGSRHY